MKSLVSAVILFASLSFRSAQAQEMQMKTPEARKPAAEGEATTETQADGATGIRVKRITHPAAKEGLYLIDEDGVYHYRVQTLSKKDNSMFFKVITQTAPNIVGHTRNNNFDFQDMYHSTQLTGVEFQYEWQPFKNFGKLGLQFGLGFATASGKGRFKNDDSSSGLVGLTPKESYTFFSLPLSLGAVYRFEYLERQWAAPYIAGGGVYNGLVEYRNDSKITAVGTPAAYGAGGLLINLTAMNKDLAFTMDREYGFSQLWITLEYKRIESFDKDLDISTNQIGVGLGADY